MALPPDSRSDRPVERGTNGGLSDRPATTRATFRIHVSPRVIRCSLRVRRFKVQIDDLSVAWRRRTNASRRPFGENDGWLAAIRHFPCFCRQAA
jgi:hypothetical protein